MTVHATFSDADYLFDGFDHVETRSEAARRLSEARPLNVKLGIDPTSPDLHLGFMVVLEKLQRFAQAGHHVTWIIGDFTARIGDPSAKNATRPQLSTDEIEANMQTYRRQAAKVLDLERITVRYNSEWLQRIDLAKLIALLSKTTVAQMLERNDFHNRYAAGTPISLHEFLYPVAQAYDSVAVEAGVELGGSDQLFNLLLGRHYQREYGQVPQICATVPLLVGLDGEKKMSKSLGNYVGVDEPPSEQFGKLMKIGDGLIPMYGRLAAFWSQAECDRIGRDMASGRSNPMEEKKRVAQAVVARYHGAQAARDARAHFEATVQRKEVPAADIPEIRSDGCVRVAEVLVKAGFAESRRAAERLIAGNGVKVDGIVVEEPRAAWSATGPAIVSVGSRKFVRVRSSEGE